LIFFFVPLDVDWSKLYAYGALGDVSMATTNMRCAANTYADLDGSFVPDYVFEQDNDFYLNSISAGQQFYIALADMKLGFLQFLLFPKFFRWAAMTLFASITLVLQLDTAKIAKINNDIFITDPTKKPSSGTSGNSGVPNPTPAPVPAPTPAPTPVPATGGGGNTPAPSPAPNSG
jgi:hypothetical protein